MKNGFIFIFAIIVALVIGAYIFYAPAQEIIDIMGSYLQDFSSFLLAKAPVVWQWITSDLARSFVILIVFLALLIGGSFGRSGTHGVITFLAYTALVVALWFISQEVSPGQIYAMGLCLAAWSLPFWISYSLLRKGSVSTAA